MGRDKKSKNRGTAKVGGNDATRGALCGKGEGDGNESTREEGTKA